MPQGNDDYVARVEQWLDEWAQRVKEKELRAKWKMARKERVTMNKLLREAKEREHDRA